MKKFFRWGFPPLFGMMIYASIRLANDIQGGRQFWMRSWVLNSIEIASAILVSYPMVYVMDYFRRRNERCDTAPLTSRLIFREFGEVYLYTTLILNAVIIPMCALTDDGLQWQDVVYVNLLPPLFNVIYYAITRAMGSLRRNYEQQLQIQKISNDRLQTELRFLRAQFHPHFLFNALNTVYFQMEEDTARARQTVEKLSELLRYQLYDPQHLVPVERELRYLESFIDLQRQRMNDHLRLDVFFDPLLVRQMVYPLLLLPLVENAFKYAGGAYWINIRASLEKDAIRFEVSNAVPPEATLVGLGATANGAPRTGIGLDNLRRRLELLYPGRHEFRAAPEDTQFKATLVIPI
ncbi:sensor histidine kinase [Dinghuibacter silviterrae]|uniref:Histidine kinase n=1 Tax=Dinghuibacter silviterrae TaxID=1539049 RepID=A0A4R8DUU9_9BACT|nr:sensor histidine kinase [Dinghuibacter silviterrae]TDX01187.1 histidine kinase [Dinghuibacter silviterrae]